LPLLRRTLQRPERCAAFLNTYQRQLFLTFHPICDLSCQTQWDTQHHSRTDDERIATQLCPTGVTTAGIQHTKLTTSNILGM